jgi:mRNA interferase RelE/StbE
MRKQPFVVEWDRKASKAFRDIDDARLRENIVDAIEKEIAPDPFVAGKPLVGPFKGTRSYRIGVIRILFKPYKDRLVVVLLDIAHRREVYRR